MEYIPYYNINLPEAHKIPYGQHTEWEGVIG